ncbi:hypothetical protein D3C85_1702170 [compost metagenome]
MGLLRAEPGRVLFGEIEFTFDEPFVVGSHCRVQVAITAIWIWLSRLLAEPVVSRTSKPDSLTTCLPGNVSTVLLGSARTAPRRAACC